MTKSKVIKCYDHTGKKIGCSHNADESCGCICHRQQIKVIPTWYRINKKGIIVKRKFQLLTPYVTKEVKSNESL